MRIFLRDSFCNSLQNQVQVLLQRIAKSHMRSLSRAPIIQREFNTLFAQPFDLIQRKQELTLLTTCWLAFLTRDSWHALVSSSALLQRKAILPYQTTGQTRIVAQFKAKRRFITLYMVFLLFVVVVSSDEHRVRVKRETRVKYVSYARLVTYSPYKMTLRTGRLR